MSREAVVRPRDSSLVLGLPSSSWTFVKAEAVGVFDPFSQRLRCDVCVHSTNSPMGPL